MKGKKHPHHDRRAHKKKDAPKRSTQRFENTIRTIARGVGFVPHPSIEKEDVRIENDNLNTALNNDLVEVELLGKKLRDQHLGCVIRVVHRSRTKFVGNVVEEDDMTFLIPDDRKSYIKILLSKDEKLSIAEKVFVELLPWTDPKELPRGKVIERLGTKGVHEVEIRSIILEKGIDDTFPKAVEDEAEKIHSAYKTENNLVGRKDFRNVPTFTIDPVDAKDFDDAISFQSLPDGTYEIGVHIADVSHFVTPGSALDQESYKRAFSAYLVDRTIPMLPEILSNDLCSLKADVDRLTFSAWFTLVQDGTVLTRNFGKSIIHSDKRFTYEEAQEVLNAGSGLYFKELNTLNTIAKKSRDERMASGAIDFEQHEVRFELADDGVPLSAYLKERLDTHKLIEEFMLLANREVAEHVRNKYGKARHAFIYRIHDTPNMEKIKDLAEFAHALGHTLEISPKGTVTGKALNKLFKDVEGTPEEDLIATAGVRSMSKAIYSTANIGHFGLALPAYTHFTSPIRRYADLIVHRLLDYMNTNGQLPNEDYATYAAIADSISNRELSIIEAERESIKLKQAEYMNARIGEAFDAVISGVSEWGIFVEEMNTHAEGLIRLSDMPNDFYKYEQKKYRIIGQKTHKTYALGDQVRITIKAVDVDKKLIECALVA
ncbi:MAG: ribonuclease R [Candidatus Campbellbacteria bacterium]|nr:ribonuclease R [Candidatus Campbellbacteria bacterium]